jgi:catechol 2,3-dioxygenase-like lactoylglutathione lyase family enzyme
MQAGEILEACVYAEDLDAAERFYTSVLGMEVIARVKGGTCSFAATRACS